MKKISIPYFDYKLETLEKEFENASKKCVNQIAKEFDLACSEGKLIFPEKGGQYFYFEFSLGKFGENPLEADKRIDCKLFTDGTGYCLRQKKLEPIHPENYPEIIRRKIDFSEEDISKVFKKMKDFLL